MQSNSSRTVLILGARGRFGLAASQAFAAKGWRVIAQIRPGVRAPEQGGVSWLSVDPDDTAALIGEEPHSELSTALQQSLRALGKMRRVGCAATAWA